MRSFLFLYILLQNVVDFLQDTLARYKEISFTEVQHEIIKEQKRKKLIYKTANAFQTFALRYGRYHLNESKPKIRKTYKEIRGKFMSSLYKHWKKKWKLYTSKKGNKSKAMPRLFVFYKEKKMETLCDKQKIKSYQDWS